MSQLNEIVINEKITVGQLIERDGVLYRCEHCAWLEDSEEAVSAAIDTGVIDDFPFLGWNATLVERPTSAQTPLSWLWTELEKDLDAERLATLKASFNVQNQSYQKSRTAEKRAQQLARTKKQKRWLIDIYTVRLAETTEPAEIKHLKSEIAKAQSYLARHGERV